MMTKLYARILVLVFLSFTAVLSQSVAAQSTRDKLETIQFPPSLTTTLLKGTLLVRCNPSEENCIYVKRGYVLHAKAGQTLTLKLSRSPGNVNVSDTLGPVIINDILGPDGKSVIPQMWRVRTSGTDG